MDGGGSSEQRQPFLVTKVINPKLPATLHRAALSMRLKQSRGVIMEPALKITQTAGELPIHGAQR